MAMNILSISLVDNKMGWSVVDNTTFELLSYGEIDIKRKELETHNEYTVSMYKIINKLINTHNTPIINIEPEGEKESVSHKLIKTIIFLIVHTNSLKLVETDREKCLETLDIRLAKGVVHRQCVEWVNNKYQIGLIYKKENSKFNEHIVAISICLASYYIGNFEAITRFGRHRRY